MPARTAPSTLCVGLTPAVQEVLEFQPFKEGGVNRPVAVTTSAAGKAVNVAHVLRTLGGRPLVLGFLGGHTGQMVRADLDRWGVQHEWVPVPEPTRICQTLLDRATGRITELVEEAALPSRPAWDGLRRKYARLAPRVAMITISGTLMPGARPDVYRELAQVAEQQAVPLIIDSQRVPLLRALPHHPLVVKLNVEELENTLERKLRSARAILGAARELIAAGARHVVVTHGARGAWLVSPDKAWRFQSPAIHAVNPIGSGDAVTAGLAYGLLEQRPLPEAVRLGIACGTANALTLTPGTVTRSTVARLLGAVRCASV